MYVKICPVCKKTFLTENNFFMSDSNLHNFCTMKKNFKHKKRQRPTRTSTPVAELENNQNLNSDDSVSEFFYQSWKRGLQSDIWKTNGMSTSQWIHYQSYSVLQPVCYAPQFVYTNTVIFQALVPVSCPQRLGYRLDGTFGVFPMYWGFNGN